MVTKVTALKRISLFLLFPFFITLNASPQSQKTKDSLKLTKNELKIPMSDGVSLSTNVFLPNGHKKFPTVLVRTPYDKFAEQWMGKAFNFFGIAVVVQDVRGRYKSEGQFYPFINERNDGLQTLRWIRNQKWSNGTVSGWGASYVGYTQWAISDSLNFLTLLLTGANIYDFLYPDGLFSLQSAFTWGLPNAAPYSGTVSKEKLTKSFSFLPLSIADDSTVRNVDFINDWIQHETADNYWQKMSFRGVTKSPLLSLAGWYDIFLKAQIEDFQALSANGNPGNRLIIGPWCHGAQAEENQYGGLKKTGNPQLIFMYVKNFLKGRSNKLKAPLKDKKYNLFIMERNEYVGSDVWPPAETRIVPYYIAENKSLTPEIPKGNGVLTYKYDPANPYPSHGGTILGNGVGPAKQNENIDRKDQLTFETNVLDIPMILLGPISATLWIASDASCTDFIVGLEDVFPDGKIINIQEGGAKIKSIGINSQKADISVWAAGYQLNPGHKLRVIITSSWFPRFNRNLNGCEEIFKASKIHVANQSVYFGPETPSSINLPLYSIEKK